MFVIKTITEKIDREIVKNIKCDICKKNLLKGKKNSDEVIVATMKLSKCIAEDIEDMGIKAPHECESCDFCQACYGKIVEFIKSLGGKIPSYYYCEDQETEDPLKELLI